MPVAGLVIGQVHTVGRGGSSICLMKGLKGALLCWLLAWIVMLSEMSLSSSFIVRSAIFQDGKRVATLCVSLMDGLYQSYLGWCRGII